MFHFHRHSLTWAFLALASLCTSANAAEYRLDIRKETVNITGKPMQRVTVNHSLPAPTLYWTEGEDVVVHITNHMNEPSSVHWHGILLPGYMDGVKGLNSYPGIEPGQTFTYRFTIRQHGTYWYHSHTKGQEQDGLYGALIIRPKGVDPIKADRDAVVMFSDFSAEKADAILANLKKSSDYYNNGRRTVGDFFSDVKAKGWKLAWQSSVDWGEMRMSPTDLADVSGYTFLINGKTPQQNWTQTFKPGETVRLQMINASAMSFYDVRILDTEKKRLKMTVVAADGRHVEPVAVDEFRFGVAETYDILVTPTEAKAYTIVAEPIDRSGFAIGTLAPGPGMKGLMPEQRPRALLTMADMGMKHDMSQMDHSTMSKAEMQEMFAQMKSGWAQSGAPLGDKVLSYADLRFLGEQADTRKEEREIVVTLGGNMERYIWTMNGKTMEDAEPVALRYGERAKLTFVNESMMAHPMHLHGMFVQLANGQPAEKLPDKTVVIVPPGKSYSVLVTADEPGEWAFHCHLLYHMSSGMMGKVVVAKFEEDPAVVHAHEDADTLHAFHLDVDAGENRDNESVANWDLDGWIGGDDNKLWLKSEGAVVGHNTQSSENWALYSRNIATFWDVQAGVRYDNKPESTGYFVTGVTGLAPYHFETQAHLFASEDGDVSFRLREENDFLFTQKLILQPFLELNVYAQDVKELDIGSGLSDASIGLQLRYEITRKFAPYVEVSYDSLFGSTADMAEAKGEHASNSSITAGVRLMF